LLLETKLRAEGFNARTIDGADSENQLNNARDAGLRYAVSAHVLDWRTQDLLGARPKVSLELNVHDLQQATIIWSSKESDVGTLDNAVTAIAAGVVADLVVAQRTSSVKTNLQSVVEQGDVKGRSVAVYYGDKPPVDQLAQFDKLILEADAINDSELQGLTKHGAVPYAYLSVGEVGPHRRYASRILPQWVLGKNNTWNSKVLDIANSEWRHFLLQRIDVLHKAGYQGLFLDTMDSYQLFATTPEARQAQELGLVTLLRQIKERYPDIRLIANRGFEVLDTAMVAGKAE